ncbi:MAG: SurA N-terminal domain-containing protein [Micropepsaceae bacterium]
MRAASKSWVAAILIGFLILSFAIWGINDIFSARSATTLARVGGLELDYRTFEQEFSNKTRNQINSSGARMTVQEARAAGYDKIVLDDMVRDMAMLAEAQRQGLAVSDAMVHATLLGIPGLAGPGGKIDPGIFQQFLQQIQMTEPQLVQLLRDDLVREQLARTAMVGAPAPRGIAIALGAYATEQRAIDYVVLPIEKAGEIADPGDAVLEAFMQANAAAYTTPELRKATVLSVNAADVAAKIEVSDSEIASEYEVRKATYETLETRDLLQITFATREDADAARKAIDEGKSFEDVATERGLSAEDINLGTLKKGDPTVPAGAFEIAEGAISQPLEGAFGWVLVKVVKVAPGSVKPLDEVKDELKSAIATERALVEISEKTSLIEDALASANSLESVPGLIGDALPLKVTTFAPVDAAGNGADGKPVAGIPDGEAFLTDVFAAQQGDTGPLAETPLHILYVLRVDDVIPPALQKVADRRADVLAAWTTAEQAKKLTEIAAATEERANASNGEPAAVAAELGLELKSAGPIGRDAAIPDVSPALVTQLFATPRGKWVTGGGAEPPFIVLARVREVVAGSGEAQGEAERAARGEATRAIADELATAFKEAIFNSTKVEIDQALFDRLRTPQQ